MPITDPIAAQRPVTDRRPNQTGANGSTMLNTRSDRLGAARAYLAEWRSQAARGRCRTPPTPQPAHHAARQPRTRPAPTSPCCTPRSSAQLPYELQLRHHSGHLPREHCVRSLTSARRDTTTGPGSLS